MGERKTRKKVAIIGGGISGIITAATLQSDGHDCTVFEAMERLGGVWAYDSYPGARLQNMGWQYHHPDLDWPTATIADEHPTREQICDYIDYCSQTFDLNVRLETRVVQLKEVHNGNGWTLVSEKHGVKDQEDFDFCIVAQGLYNDSTKRGHKASNGTIQQQWEGTDEFISKGGTIMTRHDTNMNFAKLDGKRVAVIGFGKTAVDCCELSCQNGAAETYHIFRTARWLIPETIFSIDNTWLLFNRINGETIPAWGHPGRAQHFLHSHFIWIFIYLWSGIQTLIWGLYFSHAWFKQTIIQKRFQQLRPSHPLLRDHRSAAALCPTSFFQLVADGSLIPIRGTVERCDEEGLVLSDGTKVAVDVVFVCIGNGVTTPHFSYLPHKYRQFLETDSFGPQLYRHLIHPDIPNMAFAGFNHGFLHCPHVYLGAIWISCVLRGEMKPPPDSEQRSCIARIKTWKAEHIEAEPTTNCSVATRIFHYNDTLMRDLGLKPHRKMNPIAEIFARYGAKDYAGVLHQIQQKRENPGETFQAVSLRLRHVANKKCIFFHHCTPCV